MRRSGASRIHSGAFAVLGMLATPAAAAPELDYDASLGTPPDEQGWGRAGNVTAGVEIAVEGGVLRQSTLPPEPGPCLICRGLVWRIASEPVRFGDGLAFEAELRIVASEFNASTNGAARPGFAIDLIDGDGRTFRVGFGEERVFITNNLFAGEADPGVVGMDLDTTAGFLAYRLEVDGDRARLLIDGDEALSIAGLGPTISAENIIRIGDSTGWANSSAEIRRFAVAPLDGCTADIAPPFGLLDLADINAFAQGFAAMDPIADVNADNFFDLADITVFVASFIDGCP